MIASTALGRTPTASVLRDTFGSVVVIAWSPCVVPETTHAPFASTVQSKVQVGCDTAKPRVVVHCRRKLMNQPRRSQMSAHATSGSRKQRGGEFTSDQIGRKSGQSPIDPTQSSTHGRTSPENGRMRMLVIEGCRAVSV